MFLVVVCFCSIGVLTQSPRVLIPVTELATPLGMTILLFLVWVVQCQLGLSSWFACCDSFSCSCRNLDLKSDLFDQALFFIFLAKLSIHTFVCLQKHTHGCFCELKLCIQEFILSKVCVHALVLGHSCIYHF